MTHFEVDPWRFTGRFLRGVLSGGIPDEPSYAPIPWSPLEKPLARCRVALLSTAGISMKGDPPFDMETERKRPSWGDPTWRRLTRDVGVETIEANHLHIETRHLLADLDVCFPVPLLRELEAEGVVGEVAPSHYSIMGFQGPDLRRLEPSCVAIAEAMVAEEVDLALLVPV